MLPALSAVDNSTPAPTAVNIRSPADGNIPQTVTRSKTMSFTSQTLGLVAVLWLSVSIAPTHGVLTGSGIAAFLLGSLYTFRSQRPALLALAGLHHSGSDCNNDILRVCRRQRPLGQRLPITVERETMLGKTVNTLTPINASGGKILMEGEYWNAISDTPVEKGRPMQIIAVEGLTVKVRAGPEVDI